MAGTLIFICIFSFGVILLTSSILLLKEEDDEAFHGRNYLARVESQRIASRQMAVWGGVLIASALIFCFVATAAGV